jgi:hypothetical protein
MPDGSRIFEEVDRFGIGRYGTGNQISDKADVDFFRIVPPPATPRDCQRRNARTRAKAMSHRRFPARTSFPIDRGTFRGRRRG